MATVVVMVVATFGGVVGTGVATQATASASVTLADDGISSNNYPATFTNHDWTVTLGDGVSATLQEVSLDYAGTGTTFNGLSTSDVTVYVDGSPVGPLASVTAESANERLVVSFQQGAGPALAGGETITVDLAGRKVANPSTAGTYTAGIDLNDTSTFASASTGFTVTSGTVSGSVTNASDGSAIDGATVTITESGRTVASTTTGATGAYGVDVGPGTYTVSIRKSGYTSSTTQNVGVSDGGSSTVDAALSPAGIVQGTVTNATDGTAIAGADVLLFDATSGNSYFARTDSSGNYKTAVATGNYEVEFSADGYGSAAGTVSVDVGETKTSSASLEPATSTIGGTVTNGSNTQLQGGTVTATDAKTNLKVDTAKTDASGAYSLSVPGGSYEVKATMSGYGTETASLTIADGATMTQDFSLVQAGTVSGTVTNDSGSGLPGVWVMAYDPATGSTVKSTQTDASGAYTLSVAPGTYDVIAYDPQGNYEDGFTFDVTVQSGTTVTADVTMEAAPPEGTIVGTVRGPNGNAVSGATVEAVDETYTNFQSATTDASGQFSLSVPIGNYTVSTSASGYASGTPASVAVSAGTTSTASMNLTRPSYVAGTVSNASGGVGGATVVADAGDRTAFARTNAKGEYNITVQPGTEYRVSVYAENQSAPARSATPSPDSTATADFTLETTEIKHSSLTVENPAGVQTKALGLSAEVRQGMMMVQVLDTSSKAREGMPNELEGLGVDGDTVFEINLTVTNYDPSTLLWGARNVSWSTSENQSVANATDVTIRTSAVDLQGVNDRQTTIGPLMTKQPSDVQWPSGRNDRADLGWNRTVYFGLFDMSSAPADVRDRFGGMTVTTNAQTFAPPRVENGTLKVWVAGPHRTVEGETHSGFYEATIPDSQLREWGVDPANAKEELAVSYQGNQQSFSVTDLPDGVRISLDIHYSAGTVSVSPSAAAGGDGGGSDGGSSGGSSGGSGSAESDLVSPVRLTDTGEAIAVYQRVTAGEPIVVAVEGVAAGGVTVTETNVTFGVDSTVDSDLFVSAATAPPEDVPARSGGSVLGYVALDVVGELDGHVDTGSFAFTVDEERLAALGGDAEDVQAYHYDAADEEWTAVPTTHRGNGSYAVTTDGFSTFAVVVEGASEATATPTADATPADDSTSPTATEEPSAEDTSTSTPDRDDETTPAPTTTSSGDGPGFGPFAALLAVVAAVAVLRTRRR